MDRIRKMREKMKGKKLIETFVFNKIIDLSKNFKIIFKSKVRLKKEMK